MKKMMAKMVQYSGMALIFLAAGLSDGGASLGMVIPAVFAGLLMTLGGNFAAWKCRHPGRKPSQVRFRPGDAPALAGTPAPVTTMPIRVMSKVG